MIKSHPANGTHLGGRSPPPPNIVYCRLMIKIDNLFVEIKMDSDQEQISKVKQQSMIKSTSLSLLLIYLAGLGPTSFQMFLPSIPSLVRDFDVSPSVANLTVSLSMISFSIAALVYGSLSQRMKPKTLLLIGMSILACGSVLCLLAPNIEWVIFGRIVQPLGGASGVVISRLIVADCFEGKYSADLMSKLAASMMFSPLLGIPLGGYLTQHFGWRFVLVFILSAAVIACILIILILEKVCNERKDTEPSKQNLLRDYATLLRNRAFMFSSGHFSFSLAALMCFLSAAPLVLATLFQMEASSISLTLTIVSVCAVVGNLIAPFFPEIISVNQRLLFGAAIAFASGVVAIVLTVFGGVSFVVLVAPVMVFSFCNGIASPVSQMKAIQANSQLSGTASGLSMFLSMFIASIATQVVSSFNYGSKYIIAVPLLLFTSLALVSVLSITRVIRRINYNQA